jgi:cytochrome c-type biogenesis protein CcmH/NrfG
VIEFVIGSGPELPGALQLAGRIYSQAGRHGDAVAAYDRLLAIEPDRPNIAQLRDRSAKALARQSQQA